MISKSQQQQNESTLDNVVEHICSQLEDGQSVDLEQLLEQYPDWADRLRVIFPTLLAMADWRDSDSQTSSQNTALAGFENREIGDFRIIRQIGRGGMGVVYEAQQQSIARRVALKILPLAALVDHRALQRFKNEVTAIATLEHPHIVSVYSVGEERGIHYFAMQLIHGQSLAAVIRELRARTEYDGSVTGASLNQVVSDLEDESQEKKNSEKTGASETPVDELTETAAIETQARGRSTTDAAKITDQTYFRNVVCLTLQAADALQHAHDHGIVHRDVKPGNLLLDKHGSLFVTDFGLARIETGAGVTMTGDVLGTLRYMSPEQVLANRVVIDHRTDIYSLGAMLYELLTLQPIWPGNDKAELIRQISFDEPAPPQKLNPAIPTDLETIVLKAITKNPADRYDSMQTFADDLQCLLDHKPIVAKRPSLIQRINKWSHRHPAFVWAASLVMLILTVGSAVSAGLIWSANVETEKQAQRAEHHLDRVLRAVDNFLWRVGESHLANIPGSDRLRKKLLEDALAICESLTQEQGESPQVQLRSTGARASMGTIHSELGNDEAAEQELTTAIAEFESWIKKYPDNKMFARAMQDLGGTYNNLGSLYIGIGKHQQAVEMFETSLAKGRELDALGIDSDNPRDQLLRSITYLNFASALTDLSRGAESEGALREAVKLLTNLVDRFPDEPDYHVELGGAYGRLGGAANYDKAITILRQWSDKCSNVARAKSNMGSALLANARAVGRDPLTRNLKKSELLLGEAVSIFRQLADQFPNQPDYRVSLTMGQLHLAGLYREQGDIPKSVNLLEETIPIQQSLVDEYPTRPDYRADLANQLMDFSSVVGWLGPSQKSNDILREAIGHYETLTRDFPAVADYRSKLASCYYNLAIAFESAGAVKDALESYQTAFSIAKPLADEFPDNPGHLAFLSDVYSQWAGHYLGQDEIDAALDKSHLALEICQNLLKQFPENKSYLERMVGSQFNLATANKAKGDLDACEKTYKEILPFVEKLSEHNPTNPNYQYNFAICHGNLADTYVKTGRETLAVKHFEIALQTAQKLAQKYQDLHVKKLNAKYLCKLIDVYADIGESEKASSALNGSTTTVTEYVNQHPDNESLLRALNQLGIAHLNLLEWEAADDCFSTIIETRGRIWSDGPANVANSVMLGGANCNRGNLLTATGQFDSAIDNYNSAIEILESADAPGTNARSFLSYSYQGRGEANRKSGRLAESLADFDNALQLTKGDRSVSELQLERLQTVAQQGDYVDAVKTAEAILTEQENESLAGPAAGVFAIAARMVGENNSDADEQRQERFNIYCDRAFELLTEFQRAGHLDDPSVANDLLHDPDWSAIRVDPRYDDLTKSIRPSPEIEADPEDEGPTRDKSGG